MNIVIADDNIKVCEGIRDIVAEDFPELEIQGLFFDGADLMNFLEKSIPDILITDICMPEFNGLDACEKIRERSPLTQIIIISGYQEFEYASAAIKCEVLAFLTKPFSNDELIKAIKKAKKEVENNIKLSAAQTDLYYSKRREEESLIDSIYSFTCEPELFSKLLLLNHSVPASNCSVMEGCIITENNLPPIIDDLDFDSNLLTSFRINQNRFVCFFLDRVAASGFLNDIKKASALNNESIKILNLSNYSFPEWCSSLRLKHIAKKYADAIINVTVNNFLSDNSELKNISSKDLHIIFNEVNNLLKTEVSLSDFESNLKSPGNIFEEYAKIFYSLDNGNDIITQIKNYIAENYSNPSLSLTLIASHLNLSTSYLSNLFKKETGTKLSEYITDLRINIAREKLTNSKLSISEISALVGINDIHYFYKKFKKETGLTPVQFQKKVK